MGRHALLRAGAQDRTRRWRPRPGVAVRLAPHRGERSRHLPQRHTRPHRGDPALPRLSRVRHHPALRHRSQWHGAHLDHRERAIRRLVHARWNRLSAHLPERPLGRRNAAGARADPRRHEGPGEPQGTHQPRLQPVVRCGSRRRHRGIRPRLVRRARLEWQLAHHRRADPLPPGPRHRRIQLLRFRLAAEARRDARNAGVLRRLLGRRFRWRIAAVAPLRAGAYPARRCRRTAPPGALQLLGSHRIRRGRGGPEGPRRQGRHAGSGAVRDGRWLVRRAQ